MLIFDSVGIGTTSPQGDLEVVSQSNTATMRLASSGASNTSQQIQFGSYSGDTFNPGASIRFSTGTTTTSRKLLATNTLMNVDADSVSLKSLSVQFSANVGSISTSMLCYSLLIYIRHIVYMRISVLLTLYRW